WADAADAAIASPAVTREILTTTLPVWSGDTGTREQGKGHPSPRFPRPRLLPVLFERYAQHDVPPGVERELLVAAQEAAVRRVRDVAHGDIDPALPAPQRPLEPRPAAREPRIRLGISVHPQRVRGRDMDERAGRRDVDEARDRVAIHRELAADPRALPAHGDVNVRPRLRLQAGIPDLVAGLAQ